MQYAFCVLRSNWKPFARRIETTIEGAAHRRAMGLQGQKSQSRKSEPLYGIIYSVLRDHLKRGVLVDGLVLGEANVARAFQTSRMPASMALDLLHKEGLISDFEGRGYVVPGRRRGSLEPRRLDLRDAGLELPAHLAERRQIRSRRDHIYRAVEHAVAACLVHGRFLLNESALAEHYSVSRTIAHEVLTQLERAGIAVQDRNQRWYAGPLTADDVAHHFQLRWLLEPEALRQSFPGLGKVEVTRRRDRAHRARNGRVAPVELERIERDLHQDTLANCSNKILLDAILRSQRVLIVTHSTFESYPRASEFLKMFAEHTQIYDALLEGNPESAAAALEAHLRRALRPNLDLLASLEPLADEHRPSYLVPAR
jgi:DNA-binding GntR family transcriptional regulator